MNNVIGKNQGRGNILLKKDLIDKLKLIEKELNGNVIPLLGELMKTLDGKKIVSSLSLSKYGFSNDTAFIKAIQVIAKIYASNIKKLITKIDEELQENIVVSSSNLNVRLTLTLFDLGILLGYEVLPIINYLLAVYYNIGTKPQIDVIGLRSRLTYLAEIASKGKKLSIPDMVDLIGKFPTLRTGKGEMISSVVSNFLTKDLKVSSKIVVSYLLNAFNVFKADRQKNKKNNIELKSRMKLNFTGNPIYHIRLFFTDLELNRLDRLKDEKRLTELKIAKLKAMKENSNDPKLDQQIQYYEDKLNGINHKIDVILGNTNLKQKVR